jgi:hypothetical protein
MIVVSEATLAIRPPSMAGDFAFRRLKPNASLLHLDVHPHAGMDAAHDLVFACRGKRHL